MFNEDLLITHWRISLLVAHQCTYVKKTMRMLISIMCHWMMRLCILFYALVWLFHNHDYKGIIYKSLMIISVFGFFFNTFHHILFYFSCKHTLFDFMGLIFLAQLKCHCLPSFLYNLLIIVDLANVLFLAFFVLF